MIRYDEYGPDRWLDEGLVVVTVNYRGGALGFLSLGTPEVTTRHTPESQINSPNTALQGSGQPGFVGPAHGLGVCASQHCTVWRGPCHGKNDKGTLLRKYGYVAYLAIGNVVWGAC